MNDATSRGESSKDRSLAGRNVCVVYDCLFPLTMGGAERWYRSLVDHLVAAGANVTYLTRRQWSTASPEWNGVKVIDVSGASELYDLSGVRRTAPALAFGFGTFWWMLHHRREFDAIVVASFPFFSLLGLRGALVGNRTPILVDYFEVWSSDYWKSYAGEFTGTVGSVIQRLCIATTRFAQVFTSQSAQQLRSQGFRGDVAVLPGLLSSKSDTIEVPVTTPPDPPMILFVGRHVKHKGVRLLPEILRATRASLPELRMTIVSDGPERPEVENDMEHFGLSNAVTFTGSVSDKTLRKLFEEASCTIVPSLREGYGLVVAESVNVGTPVVVANNPENLATNLVEEGVNGFVVEPLVDEIARGIVAVVSRGASLRASTYEWSARHSAHKSMEHSAHEMVDRLSLLSHH
ncbi:MAG: glycosyltransferase [Acidimicrobiaceae bacterium]|nr:glycosyltransferase [Acidimicrobiaceae bacterium]